jgi:aspartyl-tRNA synthetase
LVSERPSGNENLSNPTGEIEVVASEVKVLSEAAPLPFPIDSGEVVNVSEEIRLKYRYLDLRRETPGKALRLRSKVTAACRTVMEREGFLEI